MTGMRSRWRRKASKWTRARRGRGISDVVATILLLALTVTLFASIFAFVSSFPSPAPQSNNQFQASLLYTSNLTYVSGVRIVHLAGPVIPGNALIYLKSANQPTAPEFGHPYLVSYGLSGSSVWNLGQTWAINFNSTQMPRSQGNITIYIVSQAQLLFTVILPGTPISAAPTVVATSVSPATPIVGQRFTVYATLSGGYKSNSVYVNLASVPGAPSTAQKMTLNGQGQWIYNLTAGATKNGTYYGFVNASGLNNSGLTAIGAVTIIIVNPGSSVTSPITVGVVAIPQPPTNYIGTSYFAAVVSYTGSVANAALNVSFWVNQTPHSPFTAHSKSSTTLTGPSQPLTISGPSTVTVYGISPKGGAFSSWLLNSSVWVNASATITGVGSASGSDPIRTPNYIAANVWYSKAPVHGCTTTGSSPTCGYVNVTVWDNWTTALGGPLKLNFSGVVWAWNPSNGTDIGSVPFTAVSQGSSTVYSFGRWSPSTKGTLEFFLTLTVYNGPATTSPIVQWLYDTTTYQAS